MADESILPGRVLCQLHLRLVKIVLGHFISVDSVWFTLEKSDLDVELILVIPACVCIRVFSLELLFHVFPRVTVTAYSAEGKPQDRGLSVCLSVTRSRL